jgi:predicted transcriptional regulator
MEAQEVGLVVCEFPQEVEKYINGKVEKNGSGGRPHFVSTISKTGNPKDILLDILEAAWLKNKSIGSLARKYNTTYQTIWRMIQDLEAWKQPLISYMQQTPRRKLFYNQDADTSDYETVQIYIRRAKRDGVRKYKAQLQHAEKCWQFLKYKDPANWTADDVQGFLAQQKEGSQSGCLDGIRMVAPQIRDKFNQHYVSTGRFREKLRLRKKDLFGNEIHALDKALEKLGMTYHQTIIELAITGGFREGKEGKAGITGISWDRFKQSFTRVDDYETKVRGGIWWRDCPTDIFWPDLPEKLKKIWIERGKPITDKVIMGGYPELTKIYAEVREALAIHFKDKLDPSLFKEYTTLKPHDADKVHCNLLWEAEVPLETVAGQFLGRGEGIGLVGRGWLDINTIKKHYLSLTQRSQRFQKVMDRIRSYSHTFNGDAGNKIIAPSQINETEDDNTRSFNARKWG